MREGERVRERERVREGGKRRSKCRCSKQIHHKNKGEKTNLGNAPALAALTAARSFGTWVGKISVCKSLGGTAGSAASPPPPGVAGVPGVAGEAVAAALMAAAIGVPGSANRDPDRL